MTEREYTDGDEIIVDFRGLSEIQYLHTKQQGEVCGRTEQNGEQRLLVDLDHTGVVYAVPETAVVDTASIEQQ